MASFIQTLRDHAKQVVKLEDTHAADFLKLLKLTESEIVGRLSAIADKDTAFTTFELQRVLGEVKTAISSLELKAADFYGAAQEDAINLAVEHAVAELTQVSAVAEAPLTLSLDAAAGLSDPAQALLANHFESSVQSYGIDVLNAVRRNVQMSMLTGDPSSKVVSTVQNAINGSKSQAERLVRTGASNAYGAAQHRSIKEAAKVVPGLKKVWIHQSSYPCKICMPLHGTERPIDGTWTIKNGKKTKRVAHAPAHSNCTCRVASMTPTWRNKLKKLGYLESQENEE